MQTIKVNIAVIGGGAAGLMAAYQASSSDLSVAVLEQNKTLGVKLLITGKDRCNLTNADTDIHNFIDKFGKKGRFLLSSLYSFSIEDTISFFNDNNLPTKVERGGRIFPVSDKAKDVQELFIRLLNENNVRVFLNSKVKSIIKSDKRISKIETDKFTLHADKVIVCTGGLSYPGTGSTGDGFKWAKSLGHKVIPLKPALTPILLKEKWIKSLEGLSLKNIQISVFQNNKKKDSRFGEALFTDKGMSGPIILDMSKEIGNLLVKGPVQLTIDFKPALDFKTLDNRIIKDIEKSPNKKLKNLLAGLLPKKLIPIFLDILMLDPEKKNNTLTKEERKKLRSHLKEFSLNVEKLLGFKKAIITSGGIDLREIDPDTMKSKIIDNLYFAGEIIDLDAPTGGYNLQLCWSTGYLAGTSVLSEHK